MHREETQYCLRSLLGNCGSGFPGRECLQVLTTDANESGELRRLEYLEYQRMEAEVRTGSCRWSGTGLGMNSVVLVA